MPLSTKQFALIGSGVATIGGGSLGAYYLLQEKTIKGRLTKSGETLAKEDKDYEDIFKALKNEEELIKLITTTEKQINNKTPDVEAGKALKSWCNKNLEKDLSDKESESLIEKARKYCTKAPLTIGEKISKSSKKLVSDWKTRFNSIKTEASKGQLLQDLQKIDSTIDKFEGSEKIAKAEKALQEWCNQKERTNLSDDANNLIWIEVGVRCLEKRG